MKVELISHSVAPEETATAAIRQCYSSDSAVDIAGTVEPAVVERLVKQVRSSGHTSTLEHAVFTFSVEGISRACSHQLVRHRMASYSQQSQRYVAEKGEPEYVIPPEILSSPPALELFNCAMSSAYTAYNDLIAAGIKPEDARYVLPNATATKIVITMNSRSLLNFFRERLCERAQWEIRELAERMLALVEEVAPVIFSDVGPDCLTIGCRQGKLSCGHPRKKR